MCCLLFILRFVLFLFCHDLIRVDFLVGLETLIV